MNITINRGVTTYTPLQSHRMNTGMPEKCSIQMRSCRPKMTRFTLKMAGISVALNSSNARMCRLAML